jgi:Glyoxalase-like domain
MVAGWLGDTAPVAPANELPRLRQAVLAANELEPVVERLREQLGLGDPFSDPGVGHFGLRNAVFTLGDTFLEVVSPAVGDTAAGRLLARRGGDCGYMLMFQVGDLAAARERARAAGVREVFEIETDEIAEVHLHPRDMRGAIVSVSSPAPPQTWPWGGSGWERRSAPARVLGATVAVSDPDAVKRRWQSVIGGLAGVRFVGEDSDLGLVEVMIAHDRPDSPAFEAGGVRFVIASSEEDR